MRHVLIIALLVFWQSAFSQQKKIYVFKDRYNRSEQNFIDQNSSRFTEIKVMTGNSLLTNRSVDLKKVEQSLMKLYPSTNATGVLCLDLENPSFNHLKGHNITRAKKMSDNQFKVAEDEFIKLIRFIKSKRPKLQVGYFGMPFRVFDESGRRAGSPGSLDNILKEADILMPSVYMPYPASHSGLDANLKFLDVNLKAALECGARLNKPVLPFVWYFVFSPEEKFSYEILPKEEMRTYMDYIFSYSSTGNEVDGIIWWDSAVPFYKKNKGMVKQNYMKMSQRKKNLNRTDLFYYYFKQ